LREILLSLLQGWGFSDSGFFMQILSRPDDGPFPYDKLVIILGVVAATLYVACLAVYLRWVPDRPLPARRVATRKFQQLKYIGTALKNKILLRLLSAHLLFQVATHWAGNLVSFYFAYVFKEPGLILLVFFIPASAVVFSTPLWSRVANRLGRPQAMILVGLVAALGRIMLWFVEPGDTIALMVAFTVISLAGFGLISFPSAIAADVADYARWKTGDTVMSLYMSIVSLIMKIALVSAGLALWVVTLAGFEPSKSAVSPHGLAALKIISTLVPAAMYLLGSLLMLRCPLTRQALRAIQSRLDRR
jgi:Na+/melibiose symporter-like transporter